MTLAALKNSIGGRARAAFLLCAALAVGTAFGACATQEPFTPLGGGGGPAPIAGSGGASAGAAGSTVPNAGHGGDMLSGSGAPAGGASNGGTGGAPAGGGGSSGSAGSASSAGSTQAGSGGTSGSAGNAGGGAAGGAGMSGGAGGMSGGTGGTSGNAGGGTGGSSAGSGGSGGSGGAAVRCADHPIPATSKWALTASSSSPTWPLANAIDGNVNTRWSTGVDQKSDWLQVDFGVATALDTITLMLGTSPGDYPRAYEVRVSNSSQNTTASALARGNGQQATDTVVSLPTPALGRYLLISQTGSATSIWWSVAELKIGCVH